MDTIQVHQTKDYGLFKTVEGNRQLNELHKKRLMQSMSQEYVISPIIVNENHQIIDGQHRYNAAKELGLPVYYIQIEGYGLKEVQRLNQHSKNWATSDFLSGYADMGIESYVEFKKFVDEYDLAVGLMLSVAINRGYNATDLEAFKAGEFRFDDIMGAYDRIAKISALSAYTDQWSSRNFIYALLTLFKNPEFEFSLFMQKLSYQRAALVPCVKVQEYISLIEEIYNYRNRKKVILRY